VHKSNKHIEAVRDTLKHYNSF